LARIRGLVRIEAPGIRTATAAVLPIVVGQVAGNATAGLMVGLGGLSICITDKPGASIRSLLIATIAVACAAFLGPVAAQQAWSAILLIVAANFASGLMYQYGELAGQIGFATALVCAIGVGTPQHASAALERMGEFAVGGLWATLLTLPLWRWEARDATTAPATPAKLPAELPQRAGLGRWRPQVIQHAVRLAIASGAAVSLYEGLGLERGYWLILTVMVIMKPEFSTTHQRALERVAGSLVGGTLAVALAASVRNVMALDLLLAILGVLAYSHLSYDYGLYMVFLTPFVILMINTAAPGNWQVALVRIFETVIGGALAWVIAYLLRPREEEVSRRAAS
jgi:hypothetical protein